tara:strand:- start:239 stop:472 length:234 start_codon:yes stop_codon:yes gene_type:complete
VDIAIVIKKFPTMKTKSNKYTIRIIVLIISKGKTNIIENNPNEKTPIIKPSKSETTKNEKIVNLLEYGEREIYDNSF